MKVEGQHYRTISVKPEDPQVIEIIDQRPLPHQFVIEELRTVEEVAVAIRDMHVRGAGLIGATAGYGMYLAALAAPHHDLAGFLEYLAQAGEHLKATRPTAVNLAWAVERQLQAIQRQGETLAEKVQVALTTATAIADEDAAACERIGQHGLALIQQLYANHPDRPVNLLTHCNAGWLAFVDYGSATAPIYAAHQQGIPVQVWVDETRPRNQGARLTAWELGQQGVPHTVIADNVGGHLMQHGLVDLVLTGADRVTRSGDVANKIGTYLKALAAQDNQIPFYVCLPSSTFDWTMRDGVREIPIEQRDATEVTHISGWQHGAEQTVRLTPKTSPAANYGFDVTPARLITGLVTERGICVAAEAGIVGLYPEQQP